MTETAAGIEGECGEGPVRPSEPAGGRAGGWGMGGRRGRGSGSQPTDRPTHPGDFSLEGGALPFSDFGYPT